MSKELKYQQVRCLHSEKIKLDKNDGGMIHVKHFANVATSVVSTG
jgi:hypothetical protein